MPFEIIEAGGTPVHMWLPEGHEVEAAARLQLGRTSRMEFVKHLACMPDVHLGIGATVGSVVATEGAIIPSAVGVDIGCGMCAVRTSLTANDLPDSLKDIRDSIESAIPHGFVNAQKGGYTNGTWSTKFPYLNRKVWEEKLRAGYETIIQKHKNAEAKSPGLQVGTLGGGNHFIELCLDEEGRVWVMLHSGSRGVGNRIGQYFIELAKKDMQIHQINIEDKDLAYLREGTKHFDDYCEAVSWAQNYAKLNRKVMLDTILYEVLPKFFPNMSWDLGAVNCHHNYIEKEEHFGKNLWVTRKGAVRAQDGDLGIIPGSMGKKSFIVRGKGNPDTLNSCSHGAGRTMSRSAAKKIFTIEDVAEQTQGVECRKDAGVIDEIPSAYKDIDAVINVQKEHNMLEVLHTLKQVLCVKG